MSDVFDVFTPYEIGLNRLLEHLDSDRSCYADALVYQQRLQDNIAKARKYGDTDELKHERAQIMGSLNQLTLETVGTSFLDWCKSLQRGERLRKADPLFSTKALVAIGCIAVLLVIVIVIYIKTSLFPATPTATPTPTPRSTRVATYPFYVYRDSGSPENHFSFWEGIMGDGESVEFGNQIDYDHSSDCYSGDTCIRIVYTPVSPKEYWVGISWQYPQGNWGTINDGFNLSEATRLTFWARGDTGKETVSFGMGGIGRDSNSCDPDSPYPDSVCPTVQTDLLRLGVAWQPYSIDLTGEDLGHVIAGFLVSIGGDKTIVIYLDEIKYESESPLPVDPTATPTPTITLTPTPTSTSTPAFTPSPSPTSTPTPIPITPIPMDLVIRECEAGKFEDPGRGFLFPLVTCYIPQRPTAIKLSWDVTRSESYAGCIIDLPPEFASVAQTNTHLILWVQGEGGEEQFKIGLYSSDGAEWKETLPPASKDGHQVSVPLFKFVNRGIDLSQLDGLIIAFEHQLGRGSHHGGICIDEIGFGSP